VLATNARFLASEVKPIQPPEPTLQPPEQTLQPPERPSLQPPERPRQPPKRFPVSPAPKKPLKAAVTMPKGQKGKKLPSRVASPLEFRFVF
jgi:hypothetical protein